MSSTPTKDIADLDEAIRQATFQHDLAVEDLRATMARAFENPSYGMTYVTNAIKSGQTESAIRSLERDPLGNFGFQRYAYLGLWASRNPDVRTNIASLPDKIRRVSALYTAIGTFEVMRYRRSIDRDTRSAPDRDSVRGHQSDRPRGRNDD